MRMLKPKVVFLLVSFLFVSVPSIFAQQQQAAVIDEDKITGEIRSLAAKSDFFKAEELLKKNKEATRDILLKFIFSEELNDFRSWVELQYYDLAQKNEGVNKAIKKLEELSAKNTANVLLKATIAEGYLRLGDMNKAISIYEELNRANPKNAEIFSRLINYYMNHKKFSIVIKRLEPLVKKAPKDSIFTDTLGYAYLGAGRKKDYVNLYKSIAEKYDKSNDSVIRYAQALIELNMQKPALKELEKALKIDPSNIFIRETIAQIHQALGNKKAADKEFQEIKKIEPNYEPEIFNEEAVSNNQEKR